MNNIEQSYRLEAIENGQWAKIGQDAEKFIENAAEETLATVLRSHYENPIKDRKEIRLRDSFDEALATLQLIELAIETGYLHLDDVKDFVLVKFKKLLWSNASRNYLFIYENILVRFLAERVGYELGLGNIEKPKITENGCIRFAAFLATLNNWYEDKDLDKFLGLLDGYTRYDNEKEKFIRFLSDDTFDSQLSINEFEHYSSLMQGATNFILSLDELFDILSEQQQLYFGTFFSYWFARFFGYRLKDKKYIKKGMDWSSVEIDSICFSQNGLLENPERLKALFFLRVRRLRKIWQKQMEYLERAL